MIPMNDWMILEEEKDFTSKITVPEKYKEQSKITVAYRVILVGKGWTHESGQFMTSPVKPGDLVLLDIPMVARFMYKGKDYMAASARNVAFIVSRKEEE